MAHIPEVISHWNTLIENFNTSPKQFYEGVTSAVNARQIPNAKHSRIDWREGGVASAKREYLRIRRGEFFFDICGAPFGTGFFVSWWLTEMPQGCLIQLLSDIPLVGAFAKLMVAPMTYYRVDTATMFQSATHAAVLEVIDSITSAKGVRGLSDAERKPVMREF